MTSDPRITQVLQKIDPADQQVRESAWKKMNSLIKPPGSLGRLEECAVQYVSARGDLNAKVQKPSLLTFAGDHGIAEEGVSITSQDVTTLMVKCMSMGGAGINVLTRHEGMIHHVVDVGMAQPCPFKNIIHRRVANGTRNFTKEPAMPATQCADAILAGMEETQKLIDAGSTLVGTGEMGIGNTTPSAALYSVYLQLTPEKVCGCGTGVSSEVIRKKVQVVKKGIEVNQDLIAKGPFETLQSVGGLEIAAITGMILQAASQKVPVLVDGYISSAAAVAAIRMNPAVLDYCFFSHLSGDLGHGQAMTALGIKPLLDLGMRLGEGTGAALACNLVEASVKILAEMMTFEQAGIIL